MTKDFESRLAELVNESVDARLGTRRPAPPFDVSSADGDEGDELAARRRRRFTFLAVAATVAAIVVAAFALHAFAPGGRTDRHPAPVLTDPPAPSFRVVQLGGATITLPRGWVSRDYGRYVHSGAAPASPTYCLTPAAIPVSTKSIFSCPVIFTVFTPSQATLDPDSQATYYGSSAQAFDCFPDGNGRFREIAGTRTFGGRDAEFRQWTVTCPTRPRQSYVEQQYTVPTARGFSLSAPHVTPQIRAGLSLITANSTLPPLTGVVRLADRGYVRTVTPVGKNTRITIARAIQEHGKVLRRPGETATYLVPAFVYARAGGVKPGDLVYVASDGTRVTALN